METKPMKIKMLISYEGTHFRGWQRQKSPNMPTIQGSLELALTRIFNQPITLCGSGRTDAGVHARGQVAHFLAPKQLEGRRLLYSINSLTPRGIAVLALWKAPSNFHAIASAQKKTYTYEIYRSQTPCPFRERFSLWRRGDLSLERLNKYSEQLLGCHDFKSFQSQGSKVPHTVREIFEAKWSRPQENELIFRITGNGFLRQMVRSIVGTLLQLQDRGASPEELQDILRSLNRQTAGVAAPPQGLFLDSVSYPQELDSQCLRL